MWVRGQEKDILIDCNRFQIVSLKTIFRIVTNYREDDMSVYYDVLGDYSTEEKAIKVLDDIQSAKAVQSFCICNAIKYLYRWQRKSGIEDIKKAKWYIDKFLELNAGESENG